MREKIILHSLIASVLFIPLSYAQATESDEGEKIYTKYCTLCHVPTMAVVVGSPEVHSEKDWAPRIQKAWDTALADNPDLQNASEETKKAAIVDEFLKIVKTGTTAGMPPNGSCVQCSNEELKAAIQFMMPDK